MVRSLDNTLTAVDYLLFKQRFINIQEGREFYILTRFFATLNPTQIR